jgi:hypothetical protein
VYSAASVKVQLRVTGHVADFCDLRWSRPILRRVDSFADDEFRDANKIIVEHEDFAVGDQSAVDVDVDRVAGQLVERPDARS